MDIETRIMLLHFVSNAVAISASSTLSSTHHAIIPHQTPLSSPRRRGPIYKTLLGKLSNQRIIKRYKFKHSIR